MDESLRTRHQWFSGKIHRCHHTTSMGPAFDSRLMQLFFYFLSHFFEVALAFSSPRCFSLVIVMSDIPGIYLELPSLFDY
ncbi:hypothetical protein F4819DRAFT_23680 [Hypoxylon fuscum]|nr:hypothetical protein F4819DRAFT_23680 [Hypoxylon fuscum]